jgi:hypothetical protein
MFLGLYGVKVIIFDEHGMRGYYKWNKQLLKKLSWSEIQKIDHNNNGRIIIHYITKNNKQRKYKTPDFGLNPSFLFHFKKIFDFVNIQKIRPFNANGAADYFNEDMELIQEIKYDNMLGGQTFWSVVIIIAIIMEFILILFTGQIYF